MKISLFKKASLGIVFLMCSIVLFQSCLKDNFKFDKLAKTEWDPNIAAPLVYSSLSINDLLVKANKDDLIKVGTDNFITLVYSTQFLSLKASDVFVMPNQLFHSPYTLTATDVLGINATPPGSTYSVSISDTLDFDPGNGIVIDSIFFKSGGLNLDFSSDLKDNVQITFSIQKAKKNGVPLFQTINLNYTGSSPVLSNTPPVNLSGYVVDMSGPASNKIVIKETISIVKSSFTDVAGEQIRLSQTFTGLAFSKIFGYVGQQSISSVTKDTVEFGVFDAVSDIGGTFNLVDPKIKVRVTNSYGVPIDASFAQFDGYSPPSTNVSVVNVPYAIPINSPTVAQLGQAFQTTFTLDATNSNLATVFNSKPKYIIYDVATQTNPLGNVGQNFVLDTSSFKIDMDFELPLYGNASNFVIRDTLDFEFPSSENVQSLLLRTFISNGFPLDVGLQIYFTDSVYHKLDSLLNPTPLFMPSGSVDGITHKVTSSTAKTTDFNFTSTRISKLKTSKKLIISANIATAGAGNTPPANVKFYSNYKLDVKIGAQAQLKVKL